MPLVPARPLRVTVRAPPHPLAGALGPVSQVGGCPGMAPGDCVGKVRAPSCGDRPKSGVMRLALGQNMLPTRLMSNLSPQLLCFCYRSKTQGHLSKRPVIKWEGKKNITKCLNELTNYNAGLHVCALWLEQRLPPSPPTMLRATPQCLVVDFELGKHLMTLPRCPSRRPRPAVGLTHRSVPAWPGGWFNPCLLPCLHLTPILLL